MSSDNSNSITEAQIRECFSGNWVFILYPHKRLLLLAVIVPVVIIGLGTLAAVLLNVFPAFAQNMLAYSGQLLVGAGFIAYYWFASNLPRILVGMYPAFEETHPGQFIAIVQKWANRVANRPWVILLFAVGFVVTNLSDVVNLWNSPNSDWVGQPWVTNPQSVFFAIYYGFHSVLVGSFMLGSGAAGILGSILLFREILTIPVRLDYYRRLRYVSELSVGIAAWTLISFSGIIIGSFIIKPNTTSQLQLVSVFQSLLVSLALLTILITPVIFARQAIIHAKRQKIETYESHLYVLAGRIDNMIARFSTAVNADEQEHNQTALDTLRGERDILRQQIKEIEDIPAWPISVGGLLQILAAIGVPPLSVILNSVIGIFLGKSA